ncbi:MAG TPA: surface-adhesin E family protein [Brevundimonas sp.]|uniref:surface-adhesin E family protein n=1 Tax=Brevundimonas sp. TaxID=1871086 RepID=UPI002DF66A08|nr:surface-adhesin E family protein [Brevundimonas sp.]
MNVWGLMMAGACLAAPAVAAAQEEVLTTEPPAAAGAASWRTLSRTSATIYLVDVGSIAEAEGVKSVRLARTTRNPPSGADREHTVEQYQFRCPANQWRVVRTEEFGADGATIDAWDEADSTWLDVPAETNMAYLKAVACGGDVPGGRAWPRLEDFLASDRS